MGRLDLWQWVCAWSICCNTKIGTNAKPMAFGARKMSCKAGMIFHKRWMPGLQAYSRECCSLENCWKSKLVCRWCSGMFRGHFKQLGRTYHTWAQFLKPLGREFPPKTWHDTLGRPFHILWLQDRGWWLMWKTWTTTWGWFKSPVSDECWKLSVVYPKCIPPLLDEMSDWILFFQWCKLNASPKTIICTCS